MGTLDGWFFGTTRQELAQRMSTEASTVQIEPLRFLTGNDHWRLDLVNEGAYAHCTHGELDITFCPLALIGDRCLLLLEYVLY